MLGRAIGPFLAGPNGDASNGRQDFCCDFEISSSAVKSTHGCAESPANAHRPRRRAATGRLSNAGDIERAQSLIDERLRKFPSDFVLNYLTVPLVRAEMEMSRANSDPRKALQELEAAKAYDGQDVRIPYIRGMAYLRLRDAPHAAAELQRVVDRWSTHPFSAVHPLAHLGLARAAALSGDRAASRKAYQDFLALWKDADPDLPVLKEAKAEYAELSK